MIKRFIAGNPWGVACGVVLALAAYLCLVNLEYATLWHDEAPAAFFGRMLLQSGDIIGWDGRNLVGGTDGNTLTADLRDTLPPITYLINALGIWLFGDTIFAVRVLHAVIGVAALAVFYLLLRQQFPAHPRLVFFIFTFVGLSAQMLLYFRTSRYYALMILCTLLIFYFYERFCRHRQLSDWAAMLAIAILAFFNQYAATVMTILTFAAWHLCFRTRETTAMQWGLFAAAGALVAAAGLAYFYWLGIFSDARELSFENYTGTFIRSGYEGTIPLPLLTLWIYFRDTFTNDWVSYPVALWLAVLGGRWLLPRIRDRLRQRQMSKRKRAERGGKHPPPPLPESAFVPACRMLWFGVLFVFFSGIFTVQIIWIHPHADLRYFVPALPFLLVMKAMFIDWAWVRSKLLAIAAAGVLLVSNVASYPWIAVNISDYQRRVGMHLFEFVAEVHRPYDDGVAALTRYLQESAKPDDLVFVLSFNDREAMIMTAGDQFIFCCALGPDTKIPPASIAALDSPYAQHVYLEKTIPEWIINFGFPASEQKSFAFNETNYALHTILPVHHYPTQRPEINFHTFAPISYHAFAAAKLPTGIYIYRRQ